MPKFTAIIITLFAISLSCSAPFKMKGKYSFTGTVDSYLWVGKSLFKYEGDDFVLTEHESIPAYYIIIDTKGLSKKDKENVTFMCGHTYHTLSHKFHSLKLKKNQVMLYVPSEQLKHLKKGMKIEVEEYTGWGDEYMSKVTWKKLAIGNEVVSSP